MSLLRPEHAQTVREQFAARLQRPVRLVIAASQDECMYCPEVVALATELAELSPNLSVEVHDAEADVAALSMYGFDKTPALAVVAVDGAGAAHDYGIRFYL